MKIHLLRRQPLYPRAVAQNYEKIPGQRGMEFELKATVHIMGAVWYTDQNKFKRIDVTLILCAVYILYYEKI